MKEIVNKQFQEERALYNAKGVKLISCRFEGEEDGESALKESSDFILEKCFMDLRYPIWHSKNAKLNEAVLTPNCRAAIWYCDSININNSKLHGIKALRECHNVKIDNTDIISLEFGWKSSNIELNDCNFEGEYAFLDSKNIEIKKINFNGKYSFQYVKNMIIKDSKLKTKDAFWHSENVTVYDSLLEGEYLAWYSKNLTLVRCHIKGTQPLCYCNNLVLIDCTTEDCDLSFENSEVNGNIIGNIVSIKNPRRGEIEVDSCDEIIYDNCNFETLGVVKKKH